MFNTLIIHTCLERKNLFILTVCMLLAASLLTSGCSLQPKKLGKELVWDQAQDDINDLSSAQEPVDHPISLYEAMARGIKYNREHRLKMMQSALAMQQRNLSAFDLLPDLTASAGYTGRDNISASSSESYATGKESLEASTSQDKHRRTSDASFTWSVLDFGISYVRARQQSDRYLMAKEVERKTIQNIVRDIRLAWWQTLSAQRLLGKIDPLMVKVKQALETSKRIEEKRLDAPLKALTYQRSLLDMLRTLEALRKELAQAKPRLASLMGLPYTRQFTLAEPETAVPIPDIAWNVDAMEKLALMLRPELMESRYQGRISKEQTRVAMLGLLPDINLNAGWNWDSNSYLVNNSWFDYGSQVSWNLMKIFRAPSAMETAETEEKVTKERRLAMSMSVLMQVHLSKADYLQAKRQFQIEDMAFLVEDRILHQITSASQLNQKGKQALIREQLNHLLAQIRRDKAYAQLQNNFGRILSSMGVDPIPEEIDCTSVESLAQAIKDCITQWHVEDLSRVEGIGVLVPQSLTGITTSPLPLKNSIKTVQVEKNIKDIAEKETVSPSGMAAKDNDKKPTEEDATAQNSHQDIIVAPAPKKTPKTASARNVTAVQEVVPPKAKQKTAINGPKVKVDATRLSFRRQPEANAERAARSLRKDEILPLLDRKNGWVQLDLHGIKGWASDKYVTIIPK